MYVSICTLSLLWPGQARVTKAAHPYTKKYILYAHRLERRLPSPRAPGPPPRSPTSWTVCYLASVPENGTKYKKVTYYKK